GCLAATEQAGAEDKILVRAASRAHTAGWPRRYKGSVPERQGQSALGCTRTIEEKMTPLTERQKRAENVTRMLQNLGATVTNVLPLAEGRPLRFWCSDYEKRQVLQALTDAGYEPVFLGLAPQVCAKTYSMGLVNNFEIPIPADRQVIVNDRAISKDPVIDRAEEARIRRQVEL